MCPCSEPAGGHPPARSRMIHHEAGRGVLAHRGDARRCAFDGAEQRGNGHYRSIRRRQPEEISLVARLCDFKSASQNAAFHVLASLQWPACYVRETIAGPVEVSPVTELTQRYRRVRYG